jgi:3'-phosphoadenosine 5'-phosphosulfate (PAPS) 3'-phosphatase
MEPAVDAARLTRAVEHDAAVGTLTKEDASRVTHATSVQLLVAARLARDSPDVVMVAEERATARHKAGTGGLPGRVTGFVQRLLPRIAPARVQEWIDQGGGTPGRWSWILDPSGGTKALPR